MNAAAPQRFMLDLLQRGLDPALSYHGLHHTLDVVRAAADICEGEQVSAYDRLLIQAAALFHDAGFLCGYEDHEQNSCWLARRYLPDFGYSSDQIEQICHLILATRIPSSPENLLEKILCDADLDYLGRPDFFAIADTLYKEWVHFGRIENSGAWHLLQLQFIDNHVYYTGFNRSRREAGKQYNLYQLKKSTQL